MKGCRVAAIASGGVVITLVALWITAGERLVERWQVIRLDSSDAEVRLVAARRLAEMESTLAVCRLLEPIRLGERGDVSRECELLVEMGTYALPFLLEAFDEAEVFGRLRLLTILTGMGSLARPAISRLLAVEHEYLYGPTTDALSVMGEPGEVALFELLAHERVQFRVHAARALGELRPDFESALARLARSIDVREPNKRRRALAIAKRAWRDDDPVSLSGSGLER